MRFKVHSSYNLRGGSDAMHQTCGALTQLGQYAAMIYHPNVDHLPLLEPFAARYGIHHRETRVENRDEPDTVQMMPAGWGPNWWQFSPDTPSCLKFEGDNLYKSVKIMCWLGIGIWQDWEIEKDMPVNTTHRNLQLCYHACGSQRAYDFLVNSGHIAPEKVFFLRDYTNPIFLHEEDHLQNLISDKEDIVLYNPTKGIEHTEKLMAICKDIQFVPLVNITQEEMRYWGLKAKVCIDFGPFGGREKMHREMAGCGCTIITGNEGASGNPVDVPNGRRKFVRWEGHYDFIAVREQIRYDLAHYAEAMNEPHIVAYREGVRREQEVSIRDVVNMLTVLGVI